MATEPPVKTPITRKEIVTETKVVEKPVDTKDRGALVKIIIEFNDALKERFAGQRGHNPFIYIATHIDPLLRKVQDASVPLDEETVRTIVNLDVNKVTETIPPQPVRNNSVLPHEL